MRRDEVTNSQKVRTRFSDAVNFISIYSRNRKAVAGLVTFCAIGLMGILAPRISPYRPFQLTGVPLVPPSGRFPLGTDDLGRDILSGIIHGAQASLAVGLISAVLSAIIGVVIGSIAGYFGGKSDLLLSGFTEVFQVLPTFVFALAILSLFGPSFLNVIIAIAIVSWPSNARLIRGSIMSAKEQQYVLAAKAQGMGNLRIIFSEILPNVIPPVIVNTALQVAVAITTESGLGFLGLSDPKIMSWGLMMGNARPYMLVAWWMMTFPGVSIVIVVLALHFVADGLNLAVNPRRARY